MTENIKSIRPHAVAVGGIFSAVVNAVKHPLIGLLLLPLAVVFPNIAANLYYTEFSKQNYATLKKFREMQKNRGQNSKYCLKCGKVIK